MRLAPTEKFVESPVMTKASKLLTMSLEGLSVWVMRRDDVVAEGVHLGVQLDGRDAVAEVDDGGAGVFLYDAFGLLDDGERGDAFGGDDGFVVAGDGIEEETAGGD